MVANSQDYYPKGDNSSLQDLNFQNWQFLSNSWPTASMYKVLVLLSPNLAVIFSFVYSFIVILSS